MTSSLNSSKKVASSFLLAALLSTTFASTSLTMDSHVKHAYSFFPTTDIRCYIAAGVILEHVAAYIRLKTKGSKGKYSMDNFWGDLKEALKVWNILDPEYRKAFLKFYDTYRIGREFSLWPEYKEKFEQDNILISRKDNKIKSRPFGLMGFIDAYGLIQLHKLIDNGYKIATILFVAHVILDPKFRVTVGIIPKK